MSRASIDVVQALRGIAALAVVLWHASRYLGPYGSGAGAVVFGPGAGMGVDLFFMISGFIMFHTTRESDGTWRALGDFAIKRVARIWPVWIVALASALLLRADASYFADPSKLAWLWHSLMFVPTAGAPADVPPLYGTPVLGVGWTLNYEMYFYAFFGIAMLFGRWRWTAFCAWLLATLVLVPLLTGRLAQPADWLSIVEPSNGYGYASRYLGMTTNGIVWLFAAGVAIGAISHALPPVASVRLLRIAACGTVAAVAVQYVSRIHAYHGISHWGLTLVPLLLAAVMLDRRERIRLPRALIRLGDISFSLYLFHPIVQDAFDVLVAGALPVFLRTGVAAMLITTAASILVAAAAYRVLERGLCESLRRGLRQRLLGMEGAPAAIPKAA